MKDEVIFRTMKSREITELGPQLRDLVPTTVAQSDDQGRLWFQFRGDEESCYQQVCDGVSKGQWLQASDQRQSVPSLPLSFQQTIPSSLHSLITTRHLHQLKIPAVQPQPLHSALFLCRQLPSLFTHDDLIVHYPHCDECGGLVLPSIDHCPHCHLDYAPALHHVCYSSIPPCCAQIRQAKIDLQLLELALPHQQMTKKARLFWSPARRAMWMRKVRRCSTSAQLLACLLLLEQCVAKGGLMRWYKWAIPSAHAQTAVTSIAAFFVRLHSLDEAIRFVSNQDAVGEIEEDEEKMMVPKAVTLKVRVASTSKSGTPRSGASSVTSSKTTKSGSSRTEKKEKSIHSR